MANENDRMVQALTQRADELDTEAATGEEQGQPEQSPDVAPGAQAHRSPGLLRLISAEFRTVAERIRAIGHQGGTIYGDEPPAGNALQVDKQDSAEAGSSPDAG